jgi:ribokinase
MTKPKILVVGSSNTDMIIKLARIPRPGETLLGGEFAIAAGGKGANQAVAAARAGGAVTLVARVGRDMFGDETIPRLGREGIAVGNISRDTSAPSGVALIFVARSGENSIAVASGANGRLSAADVRRARREFTGAAALVMQLETPLPALNEAARMAVTNDVPIILNPAPARALPVSLLRKVTVITPNETEAECLTGVKVTGWSRAAEAARVLQSRGVKTVIITLGAKGAFVAEGDRTYRVPSLPVKAIDTTAAGDVFTGALAVKIGEGQPLAVAVRFACAAAALSVTRAGAQPSIPHRREIDRLLAKKISRTAPRLRR